MTGTPDDRRALLARAFDDLGHGDATTLRDISAPNVSWWLPLGGSEHRGITDVADALLSALAGKGAVTETVLLGADSRSAVVEQLGRDRRGSSTPVTSVLTLRDGVIAAGRTYLDVAAWLGENAGARTDTVTDARHG